MSNVMPQKRKLHVSCSNPGDDTLAMKIMATLLPRKWPSKLILKISVPKKYLLMFGNPHG